MYNGCLVEIDTDGIMLDKDPNVQKVNEFIRQLVLSTFGITTCTLEMEKETFLRGFVHKMKNYILLEETDDKEQASRMVNGTPVKVVIHGAYFKSSKAARVQDDAVQLIIDWICDDSIEPAEVYRKAIDIYSRPVEDFVMRIKMSKSRLDEYGATDAHYIADEGDKDRFDPTIMEGVYRDSLAGGSFVVDLAQQMTRLTGVIPTKRTTIEYLIVKDPVTGRKRFEVYNPKDTSQAARIAYDEYIKSIQKIFEETMIYTATARLSEDNMLDFFESLA